MSRLTAILLVALVGVCSVQGRGEPDWSQYLQANTQATGYAFTKNGVSVVKTTASASAAFRVQQASAEVFAKAVSSIYSGKTAKAAAFAAAKAIGTVLAEVYVTNSAQAHVKGKGVASGSAHADASAYAETASRAIANAYSAATNFKFEAEAKALAIALNRALAKAYATLRTSVKVGPNGHVKTYHAIYVKAFAEAVSHSIAIALAKVEADYHSGGSQSTSHASANSYVNNGSFKTHTGGVHQSGNSHVSVHGGGDHIVHQYQNW